MRSQLIILTALLGSCTMAPPPAYAPRQAAELVGRIAGAPQRCVPIQRDQGLQISSTDPGTLIYANGPTLWANRVAPCSFQPGDVLVLEPTGGSYCKGDVVRSFDAASRFPGRTCILGDFAPFRR